MATTTGVKAGRAWVSVEAVDKTATVLKRVGARMQAFASRMGTMGRNMIMKSALAAAPLALSVKTFASFDDSMKKVEARSSGTAQEMKAVRDEAQRLGRQTSFTATQVAELQGKLAQKNFSRKDMKAMTGDVLNLARAAGEGGDEDTTIAADLVSGTLRAYQMGAEKAGRVSDIFTATVNGSNFSLQGLLDGMAKGAPIAASYGMSVEETAASLASMTNLNISASEAGTAFTSFMARMSKEEFTSKFNDGLNEATGKVIKFTDDAGNLRKPLDLFAEIGEATKEMGTAQRGDLMSILFGTRQFGKALGASDGAIDAFKLLEKLQNDSVGTAKKTADKMDSGIGGSFRKLMSAVEGLAISIGESLAPTISMLADFITENVGVWTEWIEKNKGIIIIVAGIVAGFMALGIALMALSFALSGVGALFTVMGAALAVVKIIIAAILSPVGLVVAAIIAVIAILYKFSEAFRDVANSIVGFVSKRFGEIAGTMKKTIGGIIKSIAKGDLTKAWGILTTGLSTVWLQVVDGFRDAWDGFTNFFVEAWHGAMITFKRAWFSAQKTIATGILDLAAKEGILGDIMSKVIGEDVKGIKKKAAELEKKQLERLIRLQTTKIPEAQSRLAELEGEAAKEANAIKANGGIVDSDALFKQAEEDNRARHNSMNPDTFFDAMKKSDDPAERLRAIMADVVQEQRGIADMERQVSRGAQNSFDDARADMRRGFDEQIEAAERFHSTALTDRKADQEAANREREAAIREQQAKLDALVASVEDEPEDQAAGVADGLAGDMEDAKAKLDGLLDGKGGGSTGIAPTINNGLEKGTVEAAKKAYANQANSTAKKALDVAEDHKDLTDKVLGEMLVLNDKFNVA